MELKESRTYANLMSASPGKARHGGQIWHLRGKGREEGYQQIGDIFRRDLPQREGPRRIVAPSTSMVAPSPRPAVNLQKRRRRGAF